MRRFRSRSARQCDGEAYQEGEEDGVREEEVESDVKLVKDGQVGGEVEEGHAEGVVRLHLVADCQTEVQVSDNTYTRR